MKSCPIERRRQNLLTRIAKSDCCCTALEDKNRPAFAAGVQRRRRRRQNARRREVHRTSSLSCGGDGAARASSECQCNHLLTYSASDPIRLTDTATHRSTPHPAAATVSSALCCRSSRRESRDPMTYLERHGGAHVAGIVPMPATRCDDVCGRNDGNAVALFRRTR